MKIIFKITALCFVVVSLLAATGCKKSDSALVGEWELVKFAYTLDGKKFLNESIISKHTNSTINISDAIDSEWTSHNLSIYFKVCNYAYLKSGNLIQYNQEMTACYSILVPWIDDEIKVSNALQNAYKFSIKGNELMIYFTGENNKNVLIFKKR